MRVTGIAIVPSATVNGAMLGSSVMRKGIEVTPVFKWYANLRLEEVTQAEFEQLWKLTERSMEIRFYDRKQAGKDWKNRQDSTIFLEVRSYSIVLSYVERGVLTDPDLGADLAKELESFLVKKMNTTEY